MTGIDQSFTATIRKEEVMREDTNGDSDKRIIIVRDSERYYQKIMERTEIESVTSRRLEYLFIKQQLNFLTF